MKRKFLIFFLAVVFALCLSVGLSACGFGSCSSCGGGSTDVTDGPDGSGDDGSGGVSGDIGHVHDFTRTEAVAATCIAEGNIEYWYCADCGKYYSDENGINEITLYDTVTAKTEHTVVVIEGVAATCTESGLTEGGYCSVCGEVFTEQKVIAATGHTASEWLVAKEATATENGVRHKVCTVCGEELESEPIVITQVTEGLEYAEVTDGDGNVIGYEVIGAGTVTDAIIYVPSEYNSLPVIGVAQQAFNGLDFLINLIFGENVSYIDRYAVYDCENLTDIFILNEAIEIDGRLFVYLCEKLENIYFGGNAGEWEDLGLIMDVDINISYNYAHSYVLTETHAATCEQDGYNVYVCADCGREYSEVISAAGHSWSVTESKDATCNDYGYSKVVCAVCGEEKNLINEATGHTVEVWEVVSEADCENNGLKIGVCVVCGESVYSYESATGHVAGGIEYSDDSYCGEDKTGVVYCTVCGEILYSIGHNYVSTIKQATCEEDGLITYTCSKCGDVYTETLECGGHIEGEWQTEKAATCYSEGLEILCCLVCGKTLETRTVDKVAHSYANTRSSSEIVYTCTVCGYTYTEELASDSVLYTVTFVSNGGTEYDNLTVLEGTVIELPEPVCSGYEFLGWFTDESLTMLYDGSTVTQNLTLYAGWTMALEVSGESNTIETSAPKDFTFDVVSDIALTDKNLSKYVTVTDIEGNAVDEYILKTDDNVYTIAPEKDYEKGSTYIITIDPELSFGDKDGCEVWIVTGGENYNNIEYKSDVTFVSADEVYGCYTDGENSYIYLYEDLLDVGDVVVVYDDSIEDIQYILEVTVAGVYDKYYAYQVIYADADEVFETYDIYSSGDISFEGFVAEDGFIEEIEEQLVTSALYSQFVTAAKNYAKVSGEIGDYYYDFNGVSYSGSYSATNNKVVVSLTITAAFSRMNTKTNEIEDVLEFKLVIKNDLTLGYNISVKSFNNFSFLTTTTNTTTFGLYASFHKNSNAKSELSYFKELFQKAQADGENDALDSSGASTSKEIKIGELSINLYGIKFGISLKNTFSFEAVGELGAEASVTITTTSGIIYTPDNGLSTKKEYKSSASLSFYAMCKITVSDTVSLEVSLSLIGLINISLGVSAGPYFEIGGMVAATVSTKGSASIANGYLEIGVKLNVYAKLDISTTVLFWKVSFYSHTWNIYSTAHTFLSVGTKSMPLYYDVKNESFEITLDVTQSYDLTTLVDGNVVYQNLTSFSTSTKSVKSSYYIVDGSDYFTLTSGGKLTLTSKVGYTALVLQIKVCCDGIYKTVTVTVNVTHSEASVSYSAPTCFNNGQTAYTYCKVCGMILSGTNEVIPKLQHDYSVEDVSSSTLRGEATCIVKETHWYVCSLCGTKSSTLYFEVGDYSPHTYADGYTCHDRTCTVCGYLCEATTEHNFSEWIEVEGGACTEEAYSMRVCLDCKYSELSLDTSQAVHCDLQLKEEVAATCTEGGYIIFACTRCGNEVKVETDALGHNCEWVKTEEEHYLICRNEGCGDIISRDVHTSSGEATCTEDETCVICGYVINSAAGHNYEYVEEKEPTCEERGYTSYLMCSVCGDTIGFKYIAALGHTWDSGVVSLDATCTDAGEMLYTCSVCGATKTEEIEATGHGYKSTVTAPTCTEQGYTTYVCANCGDTYVDNYVTAAGHTEGKAVTENYVEATCTTDGSYDTVIYCTVCGKELNRKTTKITAYGHTWDEGKVTTEPACTTEGVTTYTCTVCGETKTESIKSLGHNYELSEIIKEPTYTETGLYAYACTRCGDTYTKEIAVLGHTHEYEGVVTKEPTCTEDGVMTYTCKYCDDAYTEAIPATGHKLVYVEAREATCTEVGWYAYEYCTACDHTTYKEIPATGHTFVYVEVQAATCTQKGWYAYEYCTVCGYSTYKEISATGHNYKPSVTDPTCTEQGYTTYLCENCGDTYIDNIVPATGLHTYNGNTVVMGGDGYIYLNGNTTPATQAQLEAAGFVVVNQDCEQGAQIDTQYGYVCEVCGNAIEGGVEPTAHVYSEVKDVSCEEDGYNYCVYCGAIDGTSIVPATGHKITTNSGDVYYILVIDNDLYVSEIAGEFGSTPATYAELKALDLGFVIGDCTQGIALDSQMLTCDVCGNHLTGILEGQDHDWELAYTTAATCTENALEHYACNVCYNTFIVVIENTATGHNYSATFNFDSVEATGTVTVTIICGNGCGNGVTDAEATVTSVYTAETCTADSYTTYTATYTFDGETFTDYCVVMHTGTVIGYHVATSGAMFVLDDNYYIYIGTDAINAIAAIGYDVTDASYATVVANYAATRTEVEAIGGEWLRGGETDCTRIAYYSVTCDGSTNSCGFVFTVVAQGETEHNVYATWTWSGDYTEAVLTLTCTNGTCTYSSSETVTNITSTVDGNSNTVYTATIAVDGVDYTDSVIAISTTNHTLLRSDGSIVEMDESLVYDLAEYGELTSIGTPATCTTQGTAYFTCNVCGQQIVVAVVDTNNHTLGGYEYDEDNHWQTCASCGKTFTEAHTMSNNACTVCGYSQAASGELAYELSSDNTYYTVTGIGTYTGTEVIIPETYKGLPVTAIGSEAFGENSSITSITIGENVTSIGIYAFSRCTALTSITISNSVTSIGDYALYNCTSLTSITIPNSVTAIGDWAFDSCTSLTSVTIGDSVTSIGNCAFYGCSSLTSINIPNSVTSIGVYAFRVCTSLTSVTIGSGVTYIGDCAFGYCTKLTNINVSSDNKAYKSINGNLYSNDGSTLIQYAIGKTDMSFTIPDSVTSIGDYAFSDCTSLTSITIPDSVTSIGSGAFYWCTSLKSATIGSGVTFIGGYAFYDTTYYNDANNWEGDVLYIGNYLIKAKTSISGSYSIKDGTTVIAGSAFYNCTKLTSITIPNSVISIGNNAFNYCTSLTSVTIPDSVTSLGDDAFNNCTSLISIEIPDSVTSIGSHAFYNCTSLTSVIIGDGVTSIGDRAFEYCTKLTNINVSSDNKAYKSINGNLYSYDGRTLIQYAIGKTDTSFTIPDSVTSIGNYAFYNCTSLTSITLPDSVTSIGSYAFCDCYSLTSIEIPDSVTSIGYCAFSYCTSLTSVTIGDSVTFIGERAFESCYSLTSVTIPDSVTSISDYVFSYCDSLTSITIPDSVTSIGDYAFEDCDSLTSITIPDSVTSIGDWAFGWCTALTSITIGDSVTSIGDYAFWGCTSLTSIEIPDSVTSIGDWAFYNCTSLTSMTIGSGVTYIGDCAFGYCTELTNINVSSDNKAYKSINGNLYSNDGLILIQYAIGKTDTSFTIPNSVTSIGNCAFYGCSSLTSITLPDSVSFIGGSAFYGCTSLTSITLPDSVTSIGSDAFYGCTSLISITIPDSVTSIGNWAFQDCTSLTSVTIGDGVTSIGYCAFYNCTALTSVTIGDSVTSIGDIAFYNCTALTSITIPNSVTSIGYCAFYRCTSLTSVIFENTSGWYRIEEWATSGTNILSTDLSDTSTAATYLTSSYFNYYWYRNDD